MAGQRILLLEDDANLGAILQEHLQMNGFEVTLCADGEQGLATYREGAYALCLVDIMMPRKDGFSFAAELRGRDDNVPLIFLTAKSLREDKIKGFRVGCDDYVTKPFSIEELLLRIEAVLRRSGAETEETLPTSFTIGSFQFDHTRQVLTRGRRRQKLTTKEADLLRVLCAHLNQTVPRGDALTEVWESDSYFTSRSMDVFISRLRKYLKDDPSVEIIAVHGKGFRLVVG